VQVLVAPGSHRTLEAVAALEQAVLEGQLNKSAEEQAIVAREHDKAVAAVVDPRRRKVGGCQCWDQKKLSSHKVTRARARTRAGA
jgi:hypothetical protein